MIMDRQLYLSLHEYHHNSGYYLNPREIIHYGRYSPNNRLSEEIAEKIHEMRCNYGFNTLVEEKI